jgi:hypothetical protein
VQSKPEDKDNHAHAQAREQPPYAVICVESLPKQEQECDDLTVVPIDDTVRFQKGVAVFPPSIYKGEVLISEQGKPIYMGAVCNSLVSWLEKVFPMPKGSIGGSLDNNIPLIIQSFYAVKGETYTDVSLYSLGFRPILSGWRYLRLNCSDLHLSSDYLN